jgi:anti-sigma B factor antagonist
MQLNVSTLDKDGWVVIVAEGEIDIASAPLLDDAVEDAVNGGADHIAVDLQPTSFMDSTGLRSLISAHRRLSDTGRLVVIPGSGPVRRLLEVAGVESTLTLVDSADDLPAR